jgi:hypothetical protein
MFEFSYHYATAVFQMLNGDIKSKETTLRVGFYRDAKNIHLDENIICINNDQLLIDYGSNYSINH